MGRKEEEKTFKRVEKHKRRRKEGKGKEKGQRGRKYKYREEIFYSGGVSFQNI